MKYAENTSVSVEKSKAEIEILLQRYGADQFLNAWEEGRAMIQFRANGKYVKFILPLPNKTDEKFLRHPRFYRTYSSEKSLQLWEQACRQAWRALALVVKAKLEAVESGITSFEEEFFAHIVLPNGKTVFQETHKNVELAYSSGKVGNLLGFDGL